MKELDPTRPICFPTVGSYFDKNYQQFLEIPAFMEIFSPHYPSNSRVREHAEKLTRPVIFTEYAHQLGLASDRVQEQWELFYASPRIAGGAIWMFQDQGILRSATSAANVPTAAKYVWPDATHYYDTAGTDGMDGIVYSDRTPQVDYWQVRKVYSPVQISERSLAIKPGAQEMILHVENRHDFRTLAGMKLEWSLQRNGKSFQGGIAALNAAARQTETIPLKVALPQTLQGEVFALDVRCVDDKGRQFYGHLCLRTR